jgi:tetratricopeptide (TPR) repeat protein
MLLFLALLAAAALPGIAEVRVWEGTLSLPAYEEGPPDVNPPFDAFVSGKFNYPYTLRTNLTNERKDHNWRALFLENEYLKCSVLPDIGGHLYSCTDKVNGKEMFYANPSIKKANIGYRGAWAAFGIEFNFPVSHNWASMSPVDFAWHKNPDGSASVWVGNVDRVYGMQWRVELILRPGSSVLEQKVRLYNPGDLRHRFYWWNNAGVEVWDDSRVQYPMRFTASHGFRDIDTWPVDSTGTDLSIIKNQVYGPVSRFTYGSREPWMGVYHPRTKAGTVHMAYPWELPGKKIWSWGYDADAMDWRKALSDNNSAYVEVQGGLFRNQETYAFLPPQESLEFHEFWLPVRDIGGISQANLNAVLNISRPAKGRLALGVNVSHPVANATVLVKDAQRVISEQHTALTPEKTYTQTVTGVDANIKYTVEVLNTAGGVEISHTENTYDMTPSSEIRTGPQKRREYPSAGQRSEGDFLEIGNDEELNGARLNAYETYEQALKRFPQSFALNKAAGRLAVDLKRYSEAAEHLTRAQALVSNDPDIQYHLGVAYKSLGQTRNAQIEWERAELFRGWRPAALMQLARLYAQRGDTNSALEQIRRVTSEFPNTIRAGGIEIALLRHAGQNGSAKERLLYWRELDPTSSMLRYEAIKLGQRDDALWLHLAADPQRVLDIVTEYMHLGLWGDAVELLDRRYPAVDPVTAEPGSLLPQDHPMVAYFRGYCREKMSQPGAADFRAASKLSTQYVFPSRPEAFDVLRKALEQDGRDATAHFLLGSLYMSGGMADQAMGEWESARSVNRNIPVLHRNLGMTLLLVKKSPEQALNVLREGMDIDRRNIEIYTGVEQALSILGRPAGERVQALQRYPAGKAIPQVLAFDLALALAESGRGDEADRLFQNRFFSREEGGINVRQIYLEVQLQKALALARAGKRAEAASVLNGIGKEVSGLAFTRDGQQAFVNNPRFQYLLGEAQALAGNEQAARQHWSAAARSVKGMPVNAAFAYKAAQKLGEASGPEWHSTLEDALSRTSVSDDEDVPNGLVAYARGVLLQELGRTDDAARVLRGALYLPDRLMSHYLIRSALI